MPKRISKKTKEDVNQTAYRILQQSIAESEAKAPDPEIDQALRSRVMAEMGRKGGKIGGKRSLETMSAVERKKRAKKAAKARWKEPH
jgi:hypothetical protein